jgi:hypothetical protein
MLLEDRYMSLRKTSSAEFSMFWKCRYRMLIGAMLAWWL